MDFFLPLMKLALPSSRWQLLFSHRELHKVSFLQLKKKKRKPLGFQESRIKAQI
jgi:hypothetical protein